MEPQTLHEATAELRKAMEVLKVVLMKALILDIDRLKALFKKMKNGW